MQRLGISRWINSSSFALSRMAATTGNSKIKQSSGISCETQSGLVLSSKHESDVVVSAVGVTSSKGKADQSSILGSTGDPSTPVKIDPTSSSSIPRTCECTDGKAAPIPGSQLEFSSTSPAGNSNTGSDGREKAQIDSIQVDSVQLPPPINGGPSPQPH
ncbi:hypothetical protein O6H91_18G059300 [Diphasiastrum complanatum]|uniref:Uncharacterized protein n=1 Tax=Diphasiastrum complanatum TaxID=34168 RepID=A0ACC2B1N1_DIPCM|nr:hypothetical protein O6H91_18G059300 [Diphasiastrum complanatum]